MLELRSIVGSKKLPIFKFFPNAASEHEKLNKAYELYMPASFDISMPEGRIDIAYTFKEEINSAITDNITDITE